MFEAIPDGPCWQSVPVHELTHAAYDHVPCPFEDCVATSESAADATQVRSRPDDLRPLFGEDLAIRSEATAQTVSKMILSMSPNHFAKISWLHFQAQDVPSDDMRSIMAGERYFDFDMT